MGIYRFRKEKHSRIASAAIILIIIAVTLFFASPSRAQYDDVDAREELILQVVKGQYLLADGLLAYQQGTRYYLPIGELSEVFRFVAEPDLSRGYFGGWALSDDNNYSLDTQRNELVYKGQKRTLEPEEAFVEEYGGLGEMYVLLEVLNEIWPVQLSLDFSTLRINVESEEKLPFELAFEREERQTMSMERRRVIIPASERTDLPYLENDYKMITKPIIDLDQEMRWDNHNKELTGRTNINSLQDLGWMSANYSTSLAYVDGRVQEPTAMRLRFDRKAYGDDTLFAGMKQLSVGDTRARMRDLVDNGAGGRGFYVSTDPVEKRIEFDEITIEGTGLPGWEIELYRNEQLLEFGTVDSTGEYRFENVQLNFGNNIMRVVLYGPQGQVEERIEQHNISGSLLVPGETSAELGVVDVDRPLIPLTKPNRFNGEGLAESAYVAHGISQNLTVFGAASQLPVRTGETERYGSVGAMIAAFGGFGQIEAYKQVNGGNALDLRFATKMLGIRVNTKTSLFKNFESTDAGFDQSAKSFENETRLVTSVPTGFGNLGLQLNILHQELVNGLVKTSVQTQQSIGRAGLRLAHSTDSSFVNEVHEASSGRMSATYRLREWQLRGGIDYTIHPERDVTSGQVDLRYKSRDGFSAAVGGQHNFLSSNSNASFQLGYDFEDFLGSFDVDWGRENGFVFTLRGSTSLAPFDSDGSYIASSRKNSSQTPVQGTVFIDHNGDGVFDDGDSPVAEARLLINGSVTREETDENGALVASGGGGEGLAAIELDRGSLYDPYLKPASAGYRTVIRPGSAPHFNFPVIETGAIEGSVFYEANLKPIPGMKLQLVDESGAVVDAVETAYDGFYTFEFVAPGTYTVRADPSYDTINVPPETVSVSSDDLFASGVDLLLLEQAGEAGATGAAEPAETSPVEGEADARNAAVAESGRVAQTPHETPVVAETVQPAPLFTGDSSSITVKRVRIGEHPDKIRLVMDLSGSAAYNTVPKNGGAEIAVELPNVVWKAQPHWFADVGTPVISRFDVDALDGGGTLVRLIAQDRMKVVNSGILAPQGRNGYRLYIDLWRP